MSRYISVLFRYPNARFKCIICNYVYQDPLKIFSLAPDNDTITITGRIKMIIMTQHNLLP